MMRQRVQWNHVLTKCLWILALISLMCLWLGIPEWMAQIADRLAGDLVQRALGAKIYSSLEFFENRFQEVFKILFLMCVLGLIYFYVACYSRRWNGIRCLIFRVGIGFVGVNVLLAGLIHTGLFWGLWIRGEKSVNLVNWQFKSILARDTHDVTKGIILGSSQARAQLDEELINPTLSKRQAWLWELHFPGCMALEINLIFRRAFQLAAPSFVVCYVSEGTFFQDTGTTAQGYFVHVSDLPRILSWNPSHTHVVDWLQVRYSILGQFVPLYYLREPVAQSILGASMTYIDQRRHDNSLDTDLMSRARSFAQLYSSGPNSHFQFLAFQDFASLCVQRNIRLIVIQGNLNPIVDSFLPPEIRPRMENFLAELDASSDLITVVDAQQFTPDSGAVYSDLTHVDTATQHYFSTQFAEWLDKFPF